MRLLKFLSIGAASSAILLLGACSSATSWMPESEPPVEAQTRPKDRFTSEGEASATVDVQKLKTRADFAKNGVELVWRIPEVTVDSYLIKYGLVAHDLSEEEAVTANELEKFEDDNYGFVYRYVLRNVAPEETVYLTISAVKDGTVSEPSRVMVVAPDKPNAKPEPGSVTTN